MSKIKSKTSSKDEEVISISSGDESDDEMPVKSVQFIKQESNVKKEGTSKKVICEKNNIDKVNISVTTKMKKTMSEDTRSAIRVCLQKMDDEGEELSIETFKKKYPKFSNYDGRYIYPLIKEQSSKNFSSTKEKKLVMKHMQDLLDEGKEVTWERMKQRYPDVINFHWKSVMKLLPEVKSAKGFNTTSARKRSKRATRSNVNNPRNDNPQEALESVAPASNRKSHTSKRTKRSDVDPQQIRAKSLTRVLLKIFNLKENEMSEDIQKEISKYCKTLDGYGCYNESSLRDMRLLSDEDLNDKVSFMKVVHQAQFKDWLKNAQE
ncbi:predicted protein [Chaetoceros tenuissimus]|uniref:Uncharacterized protein n=1 Tax=Chaetoceros tenuissimus TaxID=426638 RepID=A0AAD3D4L3_9STRA|nr:predicted protein [Chaetoceros tenuissimus]